jgi:gluconate 2-dehydrogenase gamma chain
MAMRDRPRESSSEADSGGGRLSRRDLIKRGGGAAGAVAALQGGLLVVPGLAEAKTPQAPVEPLTAAAPQAEAPHYFTAAQAATVDAFVERLIPADENGPGASAALVWRYIDWLMTTSVNERYGPNNQTQTLQEAYTAGLAALDAYATSSQGGVFTSLSPTAQDAVLTAMAANTATGFTPSSKVFFTLVHQHALEGMFGDPYYHGNANVVGWKLIGFPGVNLIIPSKDQAIGVSVAPAHKSVVAYKFFGKDLKGMMR